MNKNQMIRKRKRDESDENGSILSYYPAKPNKPFFDPANQYEKFYSVIQPSICYICKDENIEGSTQSCSQCYKNFHNKCNSTYTGLEKEENLLSLTDICVFCDKK